MIDSLNTDSGCVWKFIDSLGMEKRCVKNYDFKWVCLKYDWQLE